MSRNRGGLLPDVALVSKQRASTYRSGRGRTWIKVKNPDSPAMTRVWER